MQTTQVQNGIASLFQMAKSTSTAMKQTTGSSFDDLLQTSKYTQGLEFLSPSFLHF